jgi:hypothetical protein
MKKLILGMLTLGLVCLDVKAQTNIPSFFTDAEGYFTSFNTNLLTFQDGYDHVDISTGTENWNNSQLLAVFHGDVHLYSLETNQSLRGVVTFYNDTTLGSLSKLDAGAGYSYVIWDTKVTGSLNAGYDWDATKAYLRPDLAFDKAMTQKTFLGINIGAPIYFHGGGRLTPNYGVKAGFNF